MMKITYLYAKIIERLRGKAIIYSHIDKTAVVNSGCNIVNTTMGRYSYCGHDCQIVNCEIGNFCSISDHVFIGGAEHPVEWVSTSPMFQNTRHSGPSKRLANFQLPASKKTIIGSDVWVGHAVTIKAGVIIGNGAVIGSNALVTKNVPPYAIVGGVPAKVIRYRFDEDIISALDKTKWWSINDTVLRDLAVELRDPNAFIIKYKIMNIKNLHWGGG